MADEGQRELRPLSSWWEQESHNSQGVADKSTCLPELTPAHTQLKNLSGPCNYNLTNVQLFTPMSTAALDIRIFVEDTRSCF